MEYGNKVKEAVRSANGTCVFPNCVPQRDIFNQGKAKDIGEDSRLWAGLEDYILEHVNPDDELSLQVFTGPIFSDFVTRSIAATRSHSNSGKLPRAFASDGELFATAYLLSQENLVDVTDLDEAVRELPLGAYMTYQRRVTRDRECDRPALLLHRQGRRTRRFRFRMSIRWMAQPAGGQDGGARARTRLYARER